MNRRKAGFTFILIGITLTVMLVFAGCDSYRRLVFTNVFSDSSFEYPASHHVVSEDNGQESSVPSVFIALIQNKVPQDQYIIVNVRQVTELFPSYTALLEYNLDFAQRSQDDNEFTVLNREKVTIDGAEGEILTYSYSRHSEPEIENGQIIRPKGIPAISYNAYFENDGLLWNIELVAIEKRAQQAEEDFQHILLSFKFLNA
jgi:hypothetical protein